MTRLLIRILLSALAFAYMLPMITGIDFNGNFVQAISVSVAFAIMFWLVDLLALALSAVLTVSTFGAALVWLIPLWILGFWVIPAIALVWVASIMPGVLTVTNWTAAAIGGLILFFISFLTSNTIMPRTNPV